MCLAAFQVESQRNYARTALGCWSDVPNMSGCIDTDVKIEEYVHTYKYIYVYIYCKWQHVCNDDSSEDNERKKIPIPVKSSQVTHCKLSFPG